VRSIAATLAVSVILVVSACNGDDSSSSSSQSGILPASCTEPCTVGKLCYASVSSTCDGTYYCWSDAKWHCAPPDGGGPGGPPPDASSGDDGPTESATPSDATGG
jgi:hypothetical protein